MGNVGRSWAIQITQGRLSARAELLTYKLGQPTTVWDSFEVRALEDHARQEEILSDLYSAALEFLERGRGLH